MHYTLSYTSPNTHYLDIVFKLDNNFEEDVYLQLPSWRPGRYEIINFAKNIQKIKVLDDLGNPISFKKISKDRWHVTKSSKTSSIYVHYNYYAFKMDAGNSYLDESQLYVNFINCLIYDVTKMNEKCLVELKIPDDFQIACGLSGPSKNVIQAESYYQLVDTPIIVSNKLKHYSYNSYGCTFHIWIMGEANINEKKILKDFQAFTSKQIEVMKVFPHPDYHFLFQILPYKHYHGVEHFNSTVITIGPSERFNKEDFYNNLLGVSSHELFHTWNVIRIRPQELMPYDFSRENYFDTGFVAEGFTTYYGDLFLVRSGVYDKKIYLHELNTILFRHFENHGRSNLSLTDSSFDLWLDGYVAGIPNRKVSIYLKGAVIALMLDLEIRSVTQNEKSLDEVMLKLWDEFGKENKGYRLQDVKHILEQVSKTSFDDFFKKYIEGTEPEEKKLEELLGFVGCKLRSLKIYSFERNFGFKILNSEGITKVGTIEPGSIAEENLSLDDEIIAVNKRKVENNFHDLIDNLKETELSIFRNKSLRSIKLKNKGEKFFLNYFIVQDPTAGKKEKENFQQWLDSSC
jgi:predicted metalloprotease with PDZ domain